MKSLKSVLEVSILGDIDDQIEAADISVKDSIEKWIKENYDCTGLKISNKPNKDGLYEVVATDVYIKNTNITLLTNGMFVWSKVKNFYCNHCKSLNSLNSAPKKVKGDFDCGGCASLKSLEGAPKEVGGDFYCYNCASLVSLKGAPKEVGKDFYCYNCSKLESLKDAPKKVGGDFFCYRTAIKDLNGAPQEVGGDFYFHECKNLSSLEGAPKEIGGNIYCRGCKITFSSDDIRKVSKVKGRTALGI